MLRLSQIMADADQSREISAAELERRRRIEFGRDDGTEHIYELYAPRPGCYTSRDPSIPPDDSECVSELTDYGLKQRSLNACDLHSVATIAELRAAVAARAMLGWAMYRESTWKDCRDALTKLDAAKAKRGLRSSGKTR